MTDRKGKGRLQQQQKTSTRHADQTEAVDFFNVLTGPELLHITEAHLPAHRERLYPPTLALSMFINQVLDADGSCQLAVNRRAAQRTMEGLNPCSIATGGLLQGELQTLGVDVMFAHHGSRHTDFRYGERLGVREHRLDWIKPARPPWMTAAQYAAVP